MDKTAIVILNWNGRKFLEEFLPSVIGHSKLPGIRIWVADNGSTDNSVGFLKETYPDIGLVCLDENHGFTGGYNLALAKIEAEYFVLLNSDVEVTTGWLDPLVKLMDSEKDIAACMPKILAFGAKSQFEYAGASGGFIDKYGFPFCRGRIFDNLEKDNGQYNSQRDIFWATGACMFVRAQVFHRLGGFDNDFFAHMEEIDLCWRMKNAGHRIVIEPASVVYHVGGGTLPNESPHKLYLNFRNNLYLLYKNLPDKKFRTTLFIRQVLDGVAALKYLAGFNFSSFAAVLKAHLSFYANRKALRAKRIEIQKNRKQSQFKEIYPRSIVVGYFLKKKKKFGELEW
ncbi:MAG: glycosyltransferase family 2 protein [Bacteroidales bacterium]|nr:glycosyltransferase family 2 protein [Bacteroidales bacterium]MCF8455664.1 glycosyltransferase family 2 protein [Bacteroidales bacterium]